MKNELEIIERTIFPIPIAMLMSNDAPAMRNVHVDPRYLSAFANRLLLFMQALLHINVSILFLKMAYLFLDNPLFFARVQDWFLMTRYLTWLESCV